ncbi:MAG: hypothetical protein R3F11_00020 [Verrucomicrobiales bacterium]
MTLAPKNLLALGASLLAALSLNACLNYQPDHKVVNPMAAVPTEFLFTDYAPLNKWLDSPIAVYIDEVPLSEVFSAPELAGVNTQVTNLPEDDPLITVDSIGMTRRQLLWAIAHEYRLYMKPIENPHGPSFIYVKGKPSLTTES